MMKKLSKRKRKWIERTVANDRTSKLLLYNRFYLFALLVVLQIAGFLLLQYVFAYNSSLGALIQSLVGILSIVFVVHILNKYDRPSAKMPWLIIILLFPVFGVPFYAYFGEGRPARKMKKRLEKSMKENERDILEACQAHDCSPERLLGGSSEGLARSRAEGITRYLRSVGAPAFIDGEVTYYESGEKTFSAVKAALEGAKKFILLEYFIVAHGKMWGEMLEILLKKANEGVQVRIIYDDFGCITTLPPAYDHYLETLHKNIRAMAFNEVVPVFALRMNNRDHRKILVVDGEVAFTGGVNLADEYINEKRRFGYWKDTGVKITGGGVQSFTRMFFDMWNAFKEEKENISSYLLFPVDKDTVAPFEEGKLLIQPYGDSPLDNKSVAESVYVDMIHRAVRYAYIFTPYLLLDDTVRTALTRASERGVDVRIVTPGIPDKKTIYRMTRANYAPLLKAGVKIYEYTPGFIHAKSLVIDDECAVVGTVNFDYRSLYLHFEDGVYFAGCEAVLNVKRDAEKTFQTSKLCTTENMRRGVIGRLWDSILRVFETLM